MDLGPQTWVLTCERDREAKSWSQGCEVRDGLLWLRWSCAGRQGARHSVLPITGEFSCSCRESPGVGSAQDWADPCKVSWAFLSAQDCHLKDQESAFEGSGRRARLEMETEDASLWPKVLCVLYDVTWTMDWPKDIEKKIKA